MTAPTGGGTWPRLPDRGRGDVAVGDGGSRRAAWCCASSARSRSSPCPCSGSARSRCSCPRVTDSPLGAALGALAALITSQVLVTLNSADAVSPYLPTRYWLAWIDFFREPILWRNIDRGLAVQAVYVVVFLGAAWAHFATKDITS